MSRLTKTELHNIAHLMDQMKCDCYSVELYPDEDSQIVAEIEHLIERIGEAINGYT